MSLDINKLIVQDLTGVNRYSFSRLSTYHTCQYQYNERYNRKKHGLSNGFSSYGTMVHSILELYFNEELGANDLKDEYVERFSEECSEGIQMLIPSKNNDFFEKYLTELYYNDGYRFFENFEGFQDNFGNKDKYKVLGVEENFNLLINHKDKPFILNGFIDLIIEKDNELYVIDHKSKGKFKSVGEKAEYCRQLALYSLYVQYKWGRPVKEAWFNQFRINHIEKFKMTDEVIEEALDWAVDTVKNIESEFLWLPNTSDIFYCTNLCDFRDECEYYAKEIEAN